jgi:hypothetical protein
MLFQALKNYSNEEFKNIWHKKSQTSIVDCCPISDLLKEVKYIVGDVVGGDCGGEFESLHDAECRYNMLVLRDASSSMTKEDALQFFYIKKVTSEIIRGGTYNTVQM